MWKILGLSSRGLKVPTCLVRPPGRDTKAGTVLWTHRPGVRNCRATSVVRGSLCGSAHSVETVEVNGYEIGPGANLSVADLEGVHLTGANLIGANFEGTPTLTAADLTGAKADEYTKWPKGFDPVAAGVTFD